MTSATVSHLKLGLSIALAGVLGGALGGVVLGLDGLAAAAPAEPTGARPRMLLDADLKAAWHAQAGAEHGPVIGSINLCAHARATHEHEHGVYHGSEWSKVLQACLVAWAATDDKADAQTAIKYFTALLDDHDVIGDGKGGDTAAQHDDGYPIRTVGPYTAIAYDWLRELMPPALRDRARARWKAWLGWYREKGYRHDTAGTNYHAGYLLAATAIAIAEAGDAGSDGSALWREVAEKMWGRDMAAAFSDDGVLAGGAWPEGWQYGPLSVAEIALGARLMRGAGVPVNTARWLDQLLRIHVYGLTPGDGVFAGGDTDDEEHAYSRPNVLTLEAIALGDASADDRKWARGELSRLQLADVDWLLYDALAAVGDKPVLPPRALWPTWYVANAVHTLFARTSWSPEAIWFVASCAPVLDVDHRHADAGNFVLSRGKDDLVVDPSPYGTQSTLTSNAPTVRSPQLPKEYQPSQGYWGDKTGFEWVTQRASGVIAARCNYAEQYKFQERATDIDSASRDFVLVPSRDGKDAALVIIDRAETGGADRQMALRFRTQGKLALAGTTATATIGASRLAITTLEHSSGTPTIAASSQKDCFQPGTVRGQCDAARVPVTDDRLELAGPSPRAIHLITATGATAATATLTGTRVSGPGWAGVKLGLRDATLVWPTRPGQAFSYDAPAGLQIVLDAPAAATITATPAGGGAAGCSVAIRAGGEPHPQPLVITLDAQCTVKPDPEAASASVTPTTVTKPVAHARSARGGCCGAQSGPASPALTGALVLGLWRWPRRRRRTERR